MKDVTLFEKSWHSVVKERCGTIWNVDSSVVKENM